MDYKRSNAPLNTVTRDVIKLSQDTGNVYETVCIIAKRANQIAVEMKKDLEKKLQEFASLNDNLEEVSENREQIEISRYYEKLPKPVLIATQEYIEGKVMYRNLVKEKEKVSPIFTENVSGAKEMAERHPLSSCDIQLPETVLRKQFTEIDPRKEKRKHHE